MRRKYKTKLTPLVLMFLAFCLLNTSTLIVSLIPSQKTTGTLTIDIKHHKSEDLIIKAGYLEVDQDFVPKLSINEYTETRIIWNKERSNNINGIYETYTLEELNFRDLKKPEKRKVVWFIEITDKGSNNLKNELTEEEKNNTGNYIAGFFITFNNITYQSFQHPFFDDGNSIRAEIYGTNNEIINIETRTTTYPRVLSVVCVSFFQFGDDLDPDNGWDCSGFIWDFYYLTWDDIIEPYHYYYTIDDGSHKTHDRIYTSTVNSLFDTIDSVTDGNSEVIMLISSHGSEYPNYFWVYDTNFLGYWYRYTAEGLAKRIDKITEEGTDFFLWTHCCNSYSWYELTNPTWHNYHLIWYSYDGSAYAGARYEEYDGFEHGIRVHGQRKVEYLFSYALAERPNMEMEDNLSGYFYID